MPVLETRPPSGPEGTGPAVKAGGGGGWFENGWMEDVNKKGEPTGVDRGARDVEGRKMGSTGRGMIQKKLACGAGLQGPTGTWGAGLGRQDIKCRTGGGGRRDGSLFDQTVQDRN